MPYTAKTDKMEAAEALMEVYYDAGIPISTLFRNQKKEILTAGLILNAGLRNAETIRFFLECGADVNADDEYGNSVLEIVLVGQGGDQPLWNPEVLEVLNEYNIWKIRVNKWIVDENCRNAPEYVQDFLDSCIVL